MEVQLLSFKTSYESPLVASQMTDGLAGIIVFMQVIN